MLRVRDKNTVPPGDFRYRDAETGALLKHPYYRQLQRKAKEYRQANNLPIGLLWDDQFEEAVCREMPDLCDDTRAESELTLPEKAAAFANSMMNWARSGFRIVTHEEYEGRETVCKTCEHWKGTRKRFVSCSKCGCSRLKLFLANVHCPVGKW